MNNYKISKHCKAIAIVKQDKEYIIVFANQQISAKKFTTLTKAEEYIQNKPYELLINLTCAIYEILNKNNTNNNNINSVSNSESKTTKQPRHDTSDNNNK